MATIFDKFMIIVHNYLWKLDVATIFDKFMIIVPKTIDNIYIWLIFFIIWNNTFSIFQYLQDLVIYCYDDYIS